jgi:hypothetical protein
MGSGIVTYELGGRQYIVAVSGTLSPFWADVNPDTPTIVVFAVLQLGPSKQALRSLHAVIAYARGAAQKLLAKKAPVANDGGGSKGDLS